MRGFFFLFFVLLSSAINAQNILPIDTTKAEKLAKKALKLMDSNKESNYEKGFAMYREAAEMGLLSAQRELAKYYINQDPPKETDAFYWWTKMANNGDVDTQYLLGYIYLGLDTTALKGHVNEILGVRYMRMAAEQGHHDAEYYYGICSLYGEYTLKNAKEGLSYIKRSADSGNALAQFELGAKYSFADVEGIEKNPKKAFEYTLKAAEHGLPVAMFNLGLLYHKGEGTEQNYDDAIYWYTKAADYGVNGAKNNLAICMEHKNSNSVDDQILHLYKKDAESGDAVAQYNLGNCYINGNGTTMDPVIAAFWYKKASETGFAPAQRQLAIQYLSGNGVEQNSQIGIDLLIKASEQNDSIAIDNLAYCYLSGEYCEIDPAKAFELSKRGCELNSGLSFERLGLCYQYGYGTPIDLDKALENFKKAFEKGQLNSGSQIGCIYMQEGKLQDVKEALRWFSLVFDKEEDHSLTWFHLGVCHELLKDGKNAVQYYKKSAELGVARAMYSLGAILYNGQITPRNVFDAKNWMRKASMQTDDKDVQEAAKKALKQMNQ